MNNREIKVIENKEIKDNKEINQMKKNPEDNRDMRIVKILNQMKIKILN